MAFTYSEIENSSYLDLSGYRITDATSVEQAYGLTGGQPLPSDESFVVNVALMLPRANDPTDLLAGDWGSRQQALQQLRADGTLWSTYGADKSQFDNAVAFLKDDLGLVVLDASNSNYVTSAESRTIWVQLQTPGQFETLFNAREFAAQMEGGGSLSGYWHGNLSLPEQLTVEGLAFDYWARTPASNLTPGASVTLPQGPQSLGNSAGSIKGVNLMPQDMAAQYDFPLDGLEVETKTIGLIEPGIGSALTGDPGGTTFQARLDQLLAGIGRDGDGTVFVQGIDGQSTTSGERSMDVSMVAATNPNGDIVLLVGSGYATAGSQSTTFTALQSAVFPGEGMPHIPVWSSSFLETQGISPDSPFYRAYQELYVDTALANQTAVSAADDGGSGEQIGNGLTNLAYNHTQPYNLLVGGSSLSSLGAAQADPTLVNSILAPALAGDLATIWRLVIGGLNILPANMTSSEFQFFVETPWNTYSVHDKEIRNYLVNSATNGGVDPTQPVPSYQVAYGLNPTTSDPLAQVGRGSPDVTINAGGNGFYQSANTDLTAFGGYYIGTSAASPMWAALIAQIDTIFADQGLPDLGYAHDLLYTASAIAPASFNDVTMGNNISSFVYGGPYTTDDDGTSVNITPTGFGYYAGPGYDLTSGLGSPNGTVLARTLSAAAHSQMYFSDEPDTIVGSLTDGWTSGVAQSLLFQTMSDKRVDVDVTIGDGGFDYTSGTSAAYAWTSRLAMQSLDPDFDADLVRLFDGYGHGAQMQYSVGASDSLSVSIGGQAGQAIQAGLTSAYGFADFMANDGVVRVARAVAVAETAGGADDQVAIVRVRQNGQDTLGVTFYKVDDLAGTINGIAPGQAGYDAAAQANAYHLATGGTMLTGPGYGNFTQNALLNVDAGNFVAMTLVNMTHGDTYRAFSQANPDGQGHLWNYGLNTWGWEDTRGGGDHDFNDLIVQIDFTSAAGSGWLV